jgi:LmbE family N-acetylglucosaminyl deacetylase
MLQKTACAVRTMVAAGGVLALAPGSAAAQDDAYTFADPATEVALTRTASGARLGWPASTSGWDTALLGLRVDARGVQAPWLEIAAGTSRVAQHLDTAASGLRWVNLSRLNGALAPGASLEIIGHGVTLVEERAELRVFANPAPGGPTLILAPHPDDAEIAAFGLYDGSDATIVTVTSGNAGDFNYRRDVSDPAEHYLFKGFLRSVDSVTVPWLGGIPPERTYNLGYFDARLRQMRGTPEQPVSEMYGPNDDVSVYRRANVSNLLPRGPRKNSWANLVEDLGTILRDLRPRRLVMPYPQLDDHADHQYTTVAAIEALRGWSEPLQVLLYTNHASSNRYPFGPAGTAISLPPWSESALPVQGVYSHRLSEEVQRRKLYALEAMHDLRLSPGEQHACATPGALPRRDDYPRNDEVDYFRRAVRPDEVFFRYDLAAAREVAASFLEPAGAAAGDR